MDRQKSLEEIESSFDLPARTFWLFDREHMRSEAWGNQFRLHVDKFYPDAKKASNKRTNFPRGVYDPQHGALTWETFMEALQVFRPLFQEMDVYLSIDDGKALRTFRFPVEPKEWQPSKGAEPLPKINERIKGKRVVDPDHFMVPPGHSDKGARGPTLVIRSVLRQKKMTIGRLQKLIDKYLENDHVRASYRTRSKGNIRNSYMQMFLGGQIKFNNFYKLMGVLGYKTLSLRVEAKVAGITKTTELSVAV